MTQPPRTRSPLRGLFLGVILSLILFPATRHLLFNMAGAIVGIILGATIVVIIHSFATARR